MDTTGYFHNRIDGQPGAPVLFLFHGTGGDENQLLDLGAKLMPGATLVSPRGDVSEHGAARFFRRTGEGVYDMEDLARAVAKMARFVETQAGSGPAHGLGYSNGANILAATMFDRPELFDAVVLMHPLIPFEPVVNGDLSAKLVLITAGRRDPICPPEATSRLAAWLRAKGADVNIAWHEGGHEVRPGEIEAAREFLAAEGMKK
jgi:phospholipase/carboxylesterase